MKQTLVNMKSIDELRIGDRIRHIHGSYQTLVVVANHDGTAIAIDTWEVMNPDEWQIVREVPE